MQPRKFSAIAIAFLLVLGLPALQPALGPSHPNRSPLSILSAGSAPDFQIAFNSPSLTVQLGTSNSTGLTLTSLNGFSGNVRLVSWVTDLIPNGPTATLSKSNVPLSSGGTSAVTLTFSTVGSQCACNFIVSVNATSGSIVHTASIPVTVVDFNISFAPSTLYVYPGNSIAYVAGVYSVNGFVGLASLQASVSPKTTGEPVVSFQNNNVTVPPDTYDNVVASTFSNTPNANYTITLTVTSNGVSKVQSVVLWVSNQFVPDFSLTSNTGLAMPAASEYDDQININGAYGFQAPISVTTSISPNVSNAPAITVSPQTADLGPTASTFVTLKIVAPYNGEGSYLINVTGTGGGKSHSIIVDMQVVAPNDFGLSLSTSTIVLTPGSTQSTDLALTGIDRFIGTVTLNYTVTPDLSGAGNVTVSPLTVPVYFTVTSYSTITVYASPTINLDTFTITITGTSGLVSHSVLLKVWIVPGTHFTHSPTPPLAGQAVVFTSAGSSLLVYAWNFGDGATARGQQVAHVYGSQGTYTVTLNIEDPFLDPLTVQSDSLFVARAPYASGIGPGTTATYDVLITAAYNTSFRVELTVVMTVVSVDGPNSTLNGSVLQYDVNVYDGGTLLNSTRESLDLTSGATTSFIVPFWLTAAKLTVGDPIYAASNFPAISSSNSTSLISPGSFRLVNHIMVNNGAVSLNAEWDARTGLLGLLTGSVWVGSALYNVNYRLIQTNAWTPLSIRFAPSQPTNGASVVGFSSTVSGGQAPYNYHWDFGDGTTSSDANPSHTYASNGNYRVTMTVSDTAGNSETVERGVLVTTSNPVFTTLSRIGMSNLAILLGLWLAFSAITTLFVARRENKRRTTAPAHGERASLNPPEST